MSPQDPRTCDYFAFFGDERDSARQDHAKDPELDRHGLFQAQHHYRVEREAGGQRQRLGNPAAALKREEGVQSLGMWGL
jgi:hypothetical protein